MSKYTLVNNLTGYSFGIYDSYEAADCDRSMLDDFELWSVEKYEN